jgi:hypothetical protein
MKTMVQGVGWLSSILTLLLMVSMISPPHAMAQVGKVEIISNIPDYDVIYLADYIDITTQKLKGTIPNVSWNISPTSDGQPGEIFIWIKATIKLKGDPESLDLIEAYTKPFHVPTFVTAEDLKEDNTGRIKIQEDITNDTQKDRLLKYAQRYPSAPIGTYTIQITAYEGKNWSSGSLRNHSGWGTYIGTLTVNLVVRNASPDEVQITLDDPQDRSLIQTTFPQFMWSSENPQAPTTIRVYEMLPIHRSPEEATNGIPHLERTFSGISSFTYPTDAPRRLETGKRYVWYITKTVKTSSSNVEKKSPIYRFKISSDDPLSRALEQFIGVMGGDLQAVYSQLQNNGWTPTGSLLLDGRRLTADDFRMLVERLVRENKQLKISVE